MSAASPRRSAPGPLADGWPAAADTSVHPAAPAGWWPVRGDRPLGAGRAGTPGSATPAAPVHRSPDGQYDKERTP